MQSNILWIRKEVRVKARQHCSFELKCKYWPDFYIRCNYKKAMLMLLLKAGYKLTKLWSTGLYIIVGILIDMWRYPQRDLYIYYHWEYRFGPEP